MPDFKLITPAKIEIEFNLYSDTAPASSAAFITILPFRRIFYHARVSGAEIWIDTMPPLDIIQENASVFVEPGEMVLGPLKPTRTKTANCLGIYYGEGKGVDAANIFARVIDNDFLKLVELGNTIWKKGPLELLFTPIGEQS